MNGIVNLFKYINEIDNPAVAVVFILLIVFLLFCAWRKLTTNEYVTAGKEAFDEQRKLYIELKEDYTKLKSQQRELKARITELKVELETCRDIVRSIRG